MSLRTAAVALAAALAAVSPSLAQAAHPRLTHADRAAIARTIDRFVRHGVERRGVAKSFNLVTPNFRGGLTRSAWKSRSIPIYPFPARGHTFPWTVQYVDGNDVGLELMLFPRKGSRLGPVSFAVDVKQIRGRWLVDAFDPVAAFAPVGGKAKAKVTAAPDFSSAVNAGAGGESRLGHAYFAIPLAAFALLLATLLGWAVVSRIRSRRAARAYRRQRELPPLPGSR